MPHKLLALDDPDTIATLYKAAPSNIKNILEKNYGYRTGIRDSSAGPDDVLSKYICSLGKQGYSINNMPTDMGGRFHPEFMICNAAAGVEFVGQVTSGEKADSILREAELKRHAQDMKASRKKPAAARRSSGHVERLFMDVDEEPVSPGKRLLDNAESPQKGINKRLFGGSKRRGKGKKARRTRRAKINK